MSDRNQALVYGANCNEIDFVNVFDELKINKYAFTGQLGPSVRCDNYRINFLNDSLHGIDLNVLAGCSSYLNLS